MNFRSNYLNRNLINIIIYDRLEWVQIDNICTYFRLKNERKSGSGAINENSERNKIYCSKVIKKSYKSSKRWKLILLIGGEQNTLKFFYRRLFLFSPLFWINFIFIANYILNFYLARNLCFFTLEWIHNFLIINIWHSSIPQSRKSQRQYANHKPFMCNILI